MAAKLSAEKMIKDLTDARVYDDKTVERLAILVSTVQQPTEITQKERIFTQEIFGPHVAQINSEGSVTFTCLAKDRNATPGEKLTCGVRDFLGYGNMGPVFAVTVKDQPMALKIYSSHQIQDLVRIHGSFGLGGMLEDLSQEDKPAFLTKLGEKVLARKPAGDYGRSKKIVKIHNVGQDPRFVYILMDLLGVETINKIDHATMNLKPVDPALWAVDCATGLCHLHMEERRLHLNIRPEAFVRKNVRIEERLPKYSFFHYPKKFPRHEGAYSMTTEFVMVDHLDTSVEAFDKGPKGLGTVGSWLYVPPEVILQLLKTLKDHHSRFVVEGQPLEEESTVTLKRSQIDDVWALGLVLYQLVSDGRMPFRNPRSVQDMITSILLQPFDFSPVRAEFKDLLEAMLTKDPAARFQRVFDGCPEKISRRKVMAEAILYRLEVIALAVKESV